ncbi:hypothetical protein [Bradyrhizobium sp. 2TAF24]|uniref:hypothetical protein n=1 Tax=Bradyrhizobium sp. 2TAF24 TaxID=3233011 RepID=UPI003F8E7D5B
MRALSFLLAFAFVLAAPALDVSAAGDALPGVGTFAYGGPPAGVSTPAIPRMAMR